jgi:hypothetical protein
MRLNIFALYSVHLCVIMSYHPMQKYGICNRSASALDTDPMQAVGTYSEVGSA